MKKQILKVYDLSRSEKVQKGIELRYLRSKKLNVGVDKMSSIIDEYHFKSVNNPFKRPIVSLTTVQILDIELCRTNYTINSLLDYEHVLNSELLKLK